MSEWISEFGHNQALAEVVKTPDANDAAAETTSEKNPRRATKQLVAGQKANAKEFLHGENFVFLKVPQNLIRPWPAVDAKSTSISQLIWIGLHCCQMAPIIVFYSDLMLKGFKKKKNCVCVFFFFNQDETDSPSKQIFLSFRGALTDIALPCVLNSDLSSFMKLHLVKRLLIWSVDYAYVCDDESNNSSFENRGYCPDEHVYLIQKAAKSEETFATFGKRFLSDKFHVGKARTKTFADWIKLLQAFRLTPKEQEEEMVGTTTSRRSASDNHVTPQKKSKTDDTDTNQTPAASLVTDEEREKKRRK